MTEEPQAFDILTVLRGLPLPGGETPRLSKTIKLHGSVAPASRVSRFDVIRVKASSIAELSGILTRMALDPSIAFIRGRLRGSNLKAVQRNAQTFEDQRLHAVMFDIDGWTPPTGVDPVRDPEGCIDRFIEECLPAVFRNVDYHWQLSASAGTAKAKGRLKAHIWFWLETPYDSATLKAWAVALGLPIDTALLHPVQIHYTAPPCLDVGVVDPLPVRSGFCAYEGQREAVPLVIDVAPLNIQRSSDPDAARSPLVELDLPDAISRAIEYLRDEAAPAIEGSRGDETAYRVACEIKDFGLSCERAAELMHGIYSEKCFPYDEDWLQAKVRSAYAHGQNPPGAKHPSAHFSDVSVPRPNGNFGAIGTWEAPDLSVLDGPYVAAPTFPRDVLGSAWTAWCEAVAAGANAPFDYVAAALLVTAAALIGNARVAEASASWREPPILWVVLVGAPSSGKSPALDPFQRILSSFEAQMAKRFDKLLREHSAATEAAKLRRKAWLKDQSDEPSEQSTEMPADAVEPDPPPRPWPASHQNEFNW